MPLTEDYIAAIGPLARAFAAYTQAMGHSPVLVGGAATAIYTSGVFPSGDFDVVAASDAAFKAAMSAEGFMPEDRPGKLRVGYYHPDHLAFGYQQVTGPLFDGRSDPTRLVRVRMQPDGDGLVLPAIEDLIADRLGQHGIASPTDDSRLRQAATLLTLAREPDLHYLRRRILDEQGDPTLLGLEGVTVKTISFEALQEQIRLRKEELGMVDTPADTEAMRNKGASRTEAKHELLRRMERRARAAGLEPIPAYFNAEPKPDDQR